MNTLKSSWNFLTFISFIILSTVSVLSFFETRAESDKKFSVIEKKVKDCEDQTRAFNQVLCATAIELNWPTVKKACGL